LEEFVPLEAGDTLVQNGATSAVGRVSSFFTRQSHLYLQWCSWLRLATRWCRTAGVLLGACGWAQSDGVL
jgi:hypothetical protein